MEEPVSPLFVAAIVVGWVVAFGLIWTTVVTLLGWRSGWRALAARYPDPMPPTRYAHPRSSGTLSGVGYRHVLRVHFGAHALHLAVNPLFRVGHPPVRIPLTALRRGQSGSFFGIRYVYLQVGTPDPVNLILPVSVVDPRIP